MLSFEQLVAGVREALRAKLGDSTSWAIVSTFAESVIVARGETLERYGVAVDLFDKVTLSESPEAVPRAYQALKECSGSRLLGPLAESTEKGSKEFACVVIEEGVSANRRLYPAATLQAAVKLFEGSQVYFTHAASMKAEPDPRDIAGFLRSPKVAFLEAAKKTAIVATFRSTAARATELLTEAFEADHPGLVGLSINASGKGQVVKISEGTVYRVDSIDEVESVDIVSKPAAGGRFLRLVAGMSPVELTEKELDLMDEKLKRLKEARPDLAARLSATPTEAEVDAMLIEALKPVATPAPTPVPAASPLDGIDTATLREAAIDHKVRKATAGREFGALRESAERVLRTLAESGCAIDVLNAEAERMVKDAAKLAEGQPGGTGAGRTVDVNHDEADKLVSALDGFFAQADQNKVPRFTSFKEAYQTITGDTRVTGLLREAKGLGRFERLTEGMTSASWANVLANTLNRALVREYNAQGGAYSDTGAGWLYEVVPVGDFKSQIGVRYGGYANLSTVAEGNPYPALASPTDEAVSYAVSKRGGVESITFEMVRNDDVGAIRRIPQRMAFAARRTLYEFAHDFYRTNANIYDGTALLVAGHGGNLGAAVLSSAAFMAGRLVMLKQTEKDSAKRLGLVPRHLMIPMDLQETAYNLFQRTTNLDPALIQSNSVVPTVHVITHLTDTNDWFMCAGVDQVEQIQIGFLDGREEPELFIADVPTGGSLFANDKIDYKIRHVYGGAVRDFRGFYGAYGI